MYVCMYEYKLLIYSICMYLLVPCTPPPLPVFTFMPTSVEMGLGSAMFFLENILASSANVSRAVGDVISMPGPCSGDIRRHHPEVFDGLPGTVASAATYRNSLPGSIGVKMQLQSDGGFHWQKNRV